MARAIHVRGGLVFDGEGGEGRRQDVLVEDGKVTAVAEQITAPPYAEVLDADGAWVTPGFIDIHTHYDAEVELAPALSESLRHGVTTVTLGSCSLSMAMGDPTDLADMFCRVEGIPRSVVHPLFTRIKTWDSPTAYLEHLAGLPLGPNLTALLGHSTIRAAAMGMGRALDAGVRPTASEMTRMHAWLDEALDAGYLGLSISTLPWDKMDGESYRSRPMPSVFARWREYRSLARVLRRRGRVLQGVPNITTKVNVLLFLLESAGIFRRPLKTTLISMMDIRADRFAFRIAGALSRLFNRFLNADFRLQALPEIFDLWADGIDLVVFEEFGAGTAALHLTNELARAQLLMDAAYRRRFKREWKNKLLPRAYHRDFAHSRILACPDPTVVGQSFGQLAAVAGQDAADVFLDLVAKHGSALRWYTVMGNDRPEWLERIVAHPDVLIGFSDAGAHLRNMAHYNFPLRMLRLVRAAEARGQAFLTIGRAIQRLTSELADWMGIPAGRLRVGDAADLVVIDPRGLGDEVEAVQEAEVPGFAGLRRLVRRNDAAVRAVVVGGRLAVHGGAVTPAVGAERGFGRVLRAGSS